MYFIKLLLVRTLGPVCQSQFKNLFGEKILIFKLPYYQTDNYLIALTVRILKGNIIEVTSRNLTLSNQWLQIIFLHNLYSSDLVCGIEGLAFSTEQFGQVHYLI